MILKKIIFGVDRKEVSHFTSIEIIQTINNHHHFKISVPYSVIEQPRAFTMENAQEWLGKVVHVILEKENNFLGVVTNIQYAQELGHTGSQIILSGYSKTILLESGQKLHSWEEATLQEIIREVIKTAADEQLQNDINPEYTTKIPYQTQYLETDFQYIQRLAKQYNEWLYCDGEKLFFGKPKPNTTSTKLIYNKDLFNLNIAVQATPNQFSGFTYNEDNNTLYQAKTKDKIDGLPKLGNQAFDASEKIYNTPSFEYGRIATGDDLFLENILKRRQESSMADANYITATSSNPTLKIGTTISVESQQVLDKSEVSQKGLDTNAIHYKNSEIGTYIITEITHKANDIGEYENSFKALPAKIKKLPEPQINFPQAQMQQAIVVENNDPKNNGRVRVQLLWQQNKNLRTPWLRVMTPDAGESGEVTKNRGMVFIPEVGDHVMLGFRYNDPNRPFVIGSLFNGKTAAGGQETNALKSIITRSGHTIKFDDTEQSESITITDKSNNVIFIDTANSSIRISAPENIDIEAKNININAQENVTINAGENVNTSANKEINTSSGTNTSNMIGEDLIINSTNMKINVSEDITEQSTKNIKKAGKIRLDSTDENLELASGKEVEIQSTEKVKLF